MSALRAVAFLLALVALAGSSYLLGRACPPERVRTGITEPSP